MCRFEVTEIYIFYEQKSYYGSHRTFKSESEGVEKQVQISKQDLPETEMTELIKHSS